MAFIENEIENKQQKLTMGENSCLRKDHFNFTRILLLSTTKYV